MSINEFSRLKRENAELKKRILELLNQITPYGALDEELTINIVDIMNDEKLEEKRIKEGSECAISRKILNAIEI